MYTWILYRFGIHCIITVVLMIVFCTQCTADSTGTSDNTGFARNSERSWELLYRFSDSFREDFLPRLGISIQKNITDKSAIAFGVGIDGQTSDRDYDSQTTLEGLIEKGGMVSNSYTFELNIDYIRNLKPGPNRSFYIGSGPFFRFAHECQEWIHETFVYRQYQRNEIDTDSYIVGVSLFSGMEWFPAKRVSFRAELGTLFEYAYTEQVELIHVINAQEDFKTGTKLNNDSFRFSPLYMRVGIGLRF